MVQTKNYTMLNSLAEKGGTVIFEGKEDSSIPLCELKQSFELSSDFYNRSFEELSVTNAKELYKSYITDLTPDTVFLHIGENDLTMFQEDSSKFINLYRELIEEIRSSNKKCRIAIVSLKNYESDAVITKLNEQLKYLADSERCEFADISEKKIWNPKGTRDAVSFAYSLGLKTQKPLYDLVKILFCYA